MNDRMASNLHGTRFTVELRIASNSRTGEEFLILSDEEMEELYTMKRRHNSKVAEVKTLMGADENIVKLQYEKDEHWLTVNHDSQKSDRDKVRDSAELHTFTLIRPTYGEHLDAEEQATDINPATFETSFNQNKYINSLFPRAIDGLSADHVRDLSPLIGRELRSRLLSSIFPAEDRVLFTTSR